MIDDIPARFLGKWRRLLNLAAELFDVPTALIMQLNPSYLEVLVACQNADNPYSEQSRLLLNTGMYCEAVLATSEELQVVDAREDPAWSANLDLHLGMVHYLGLPLIWPDGQKFGTLCVLDRKPRAHANVSRQLLRHFKEQIETDFSLLEFERSLLDSNDQLELLVDQRTAELRTEMLERARLEAALQQVRKMDALAQMAGGVAHDLNNILSGIVSYPDLLLAQLEADNPLRPALETIRDSGARAASVVQDLLTVTRPIARTKEPVDVNSVVADYLSSPEGLSLLADNRDVRLELALEVQRPKIRSTSVSLTKCLMNLAINAMDAMPDGGCLRIATRTLQLAQNERPRLKSGHYVALTVADTGPGINADEQLQIFEPYYSTKELGRSGTGLGLTTVWNIVEESEGCVFVSSSSSGTVFELFFPTTKVIESERREQPEHLGSAPDKANVLIVDDEPQQRKIIGSMLRKLGYRTTTAASGEEAIGKVKRETFDLVVLDMAMPPGIDGYQTYVQMLRQNPTQRAIISSGLLDSDEIRQLRDLGITSILAKPYTLAELSRAVRSSLSTLSPRSSTADTPI